MQWKDESDQEAESPFNKWRLKKQNKTKPIQSVYLLNIYSISYIYIYIFTALLPTQKISKQNKCKLICITALLTIRDVMIWSSCLYEAAEEEKLHYLWNPPNPIYAMKIYYVAGWNSRHWDWMTWSCLFQSYISAVELAEAHTGEICGIVSVHL